MTKNNLGHGHLLMLVDNDIINAVKCNMQTITEDRRSNLFQLIKRFDIARFGSFSRQARCSMFQPL